jgi:hypothetical protein
MKKRIRGIPLRDLFSLPRSRATLPIEHFTAQYTQATFTSRQMKFGSLKTRVIAAMIRGPMQ